MDVPSFLVVLVVLIDNLCIVSSVPCIIVRSQYRNCCGNIYRSDNPQLTIVFCYNPRPSSTCVGQPQCMTNNASSQGVLSGTSGSVSISVGQGYTVSSSFVLSCECASHTVPGLILTCHHVATTSAELFGSFTTMTTFPDITTVMQGFTTSATISNTQSDR